MIRNLTQSFVLRQRSILTLRNKATASSLKDIDIENLEDAAGIHEGNFIHITITEKKY